MLIPNSHARRASRDAAKPQGRLRPPDPSYLHQRPGTARAIAEKFGLSRPFVANILKELGQHGFVTSHRGVKGGYALARPAETSRSPSCSKTIEDGFRLTMCNPSRARARTSARSQAVCTLKGPIAEVHQRLLEVLRGGHVSPNCSTQRAMATQPSALHALPLLCGCGHAGASNQPTA